MIEVRQTPEFAEWHASLRDRRAATKIAARIDRLALGNPGDAKSVGGGVIELRIDYGPGYRLYATKRGETLVVLLCGGDKPSQPEDVKLAKVLAEGVGDDD